MYNFVDVKPRLLCSKIEVFAADNLNLNEKDFEKHIKNELAMSIARSLIDEGMIYFSKIQNPDRFSTTYISRVFIADKETTAGLIKKDNVND